MPRDYRTRYVNERHVPYGQWKKDRSRWDRDNRKAHNDGRGPRAGVEEGQKGSWGDDRRGDRDHDRGDDRRGSRKARPITAWSGGVAVGGGAQ